MLKQKFVSQSTPFLAPILTYFLLIFWHHGIITVAQSKSTTRIGAIINVDSRIGKEVITAMEMAVQSSNSISVDHMFSLHYRHPGSNPLQTAHAGDKVQVIIAMETWIETLLVAEICNQAQVPIISFATTGIASMAPLQWPFLVQMATNVTEQMRFIAAISQFFQWRRVIVIYELDRYGGDSGMFAALADQIQNVNLEIEHRLIVPPISSLADPKRLVREELAKLTSKQSRVFIVLQSSLSLTIHLFKEAKRMGLMGKDSVWIVTDIIGNMLDYVNTSVISSMEGVIGIKTYFVKDKRPFISFNRHFKEIFQSKYPEEYNFEPGIHAIRAFDSIIVITNALNSIRGNNRSPSMLLKSILLSNFTSLSGRIHFQSRQLWQSPLFSIVNVIGKSYKELGFWSSKFGFTENNKSINDDGSDDNMEALEDLVTWTGNLKHTPKGRVMLTNTKEMRIGVPSKTAFEKFVKVEAISNSTKKRYSGFCIDVFEEVLKIVQKKYPIRVDYFPYDGTYEGLIDEVFYKTFDAAIGDITILANRSKYVEFTQPFIESRLTMIVTAKPEAQKAWMFLRPFTKEMWVFTSVILFYTVFIVWLLERQSNPEFEGPWRNQLATALWFTYSSLFFTQSN
ncbi:unnamed protein product [Camellia sinensis]